MQQINILIIEDTESDIQTYKDSIKTVNMDIAPDYKINATYKTNKEGGISAISEMKDMLDGAFIDLKLSPGTTVDVNEGNDLISEIYGKLRFPIFVLTNTPGAFNTAFKQSLFLQVNTKTDVQYSDILMLLVNIFKTGITKILGKKGLIEKMLDNIFWQNISQTLGEWQKVDDGEKALLRYTLTHLQEHLEISDDGSEFDVVHPIEFYIKPSIKTYFFTGDIIKKTAENTRYIILTPACDLAPHGVTKVPKSKEVLIAEIQPLSEGVFLETIKVAKKASSDEEVLKKIEEAKSTLSRIISNNYSPKYYFLPNAGEIDGGLINFQKLSSIKLASMKTDFKKEATITTQFVKDIISKFSYYYSRQGSPDLEFNAIAKELTN
jgi:hypothetical protein